MLNDKKVMMIVSNERVVNVISPDKTNPTIHDKIYSSSENGEISAGKLYSSLAQAPKSISLQRSLQKGLDLLSCHAVLVPQLGQGYVLGKVLGFDGVVIEVRISS